MKELILIGMLLLQQPQNPAANGEIHGRLVFSDGLPAARLLLTVIDVSLPAGRAPLSFRGASDGSGAYRLTNVPSGRYYLQASVAGKAVFYPGVEREGAAIVVTVTAGSSVANADFVIPVSGVRVSGRVTVPSGQTLANPRVQMGQASASIDADGSFEFPHVFPGSYSLSVPSPGAQPVRISVADENVTGIVLSVPRLVPVSGTVVSEGGARPNLSLQFEGPTYRTSVGVRPDGTFTTQLPTGAFITTALAGPPPAVRVQVPPPFPSGYYVRQLETESQNLLTGPLRIRDGDPQVRIAMSLGRSPGVKVSGRVNAGEPKARLSRNVSLTSFVTGEMAEATVQDDGSFEIPRIPPGTYMATVTVTPEVRSAPVTVDVPNRDLSGLEIAVPESQEVVGRIAVDGNGQPPRFSLSLIRGGDSVISLDRNGMPSMAPSDAGVLARSGSAQAIDVRVDALPDGSFRMMLPQGDYRVIPAVTSPSYFIRSLTHGSARLLTEPLRVTDKESAEIHVGFGVTQQNPWRKIRGRVTGIDSIKGPFRVALEGNATATVETTIDSDGAFEFSAALANQRYRLRVVPQNDAASAPPVTVEDKDVEGVQIVVPREREIELHASVEGNAPAPKFMVSLAATATVAGRDIQSSSVSMLIEPGVDGTFKALLPEDERRLRITGLPLGYIVKSLRFGTTDLLKDNLKLAQQAGTQIEVQFALDPSASFVSIEGRVAGLDPELGGVRLVLNGAAALAAFETAVDSNGFFRFSKIPQGPYVPTLTGSVTSGLLTPSSIVANRTDLTGVEFKFSRSAERPFSGLESAPTGTTVRDLTGINPGSLQSANESAAIANLRTINTALVTYLYANNGKYGSLPDLIAAGLLDSTMDGIKAGFHLSIVTVGTEYAAAAIPATPSAGRFGFYASADAVIRYSPVGILAPSRMGGSPVQ